jgi:hypothetical protein
VVQKIVSNGDYLKLDSIFCGVIVQILAQKNFSTYVLLGFLASFDKMFSNTLHKQMKS